jgi:nucleotide-binding universal stress UspA family protein
MFQKILFAVGHDAATDAAVPVVGAYARQLEADLHVLHVHRPGEDATSERVRTMLKRIVERLEALGVHASGEARLSRRAADVPSIIKRAAVDTGADLVVIGSRGRSDLGGLFLGSVSHRVAKGLDLAVLVIRTTPGLYAPPRRVLVATDGSAASDLAVAEAGELSRRTGAALKVLHVSEIVTTLGGAFLESELEARAILDHAVALLAEPGIRVEQQTSISQTGTVEAIAETAERDGADLVVVASRRPSELSGLLLGSVAHGLIHRLSTPVLMASRPTTRPQAVERGAAADTR